MTPSTFPTAQPLQAAYGALTGLSATLAGTMPPKGIEPRSMTLRDTSAFLLREPRSMADATPRMMAAFARLVAGLCDDMDSEIMPLVDMIHQGQRLKLEMVLAELREASRSIDPPRESEDWDSESDTMLETHADETLAGARLMAVDCVATLRQGPSACSIGMRHARRLALATCLADLMSLAGEVPENHVRHVKDVLQDASERLDALAGNWIASGEETAEGEMGKWVRGTLELVQEPASRFLDATLDEGSSNSFGMR